MMLESTIIKPTNQKNNMGAITDEDYWLEPDRTEEEKQRSYDAHKALCEKNKQEMTPEEYKAWMNFFD